MAQTPEGKVKAVVKKLCKKYDAYVYMPVSNGMGAAALDFIGCINGQCFAIETKAGSGIMTPRQEHTAANMRASGVKVFLINNIYDQGFEEWLIVQYMLQVSALAAGSS